MVRVGAVFFSSSCSFFVGAFLDPGVDARSGPCRSLRQSVFLFLFFFRICDRRAILKRGVLAIFFLLDAALFLFFFCGIRGAVAGDRSCPLRASRLGPRATGCLGPPAKSARR
nr:hypothetical protein [Pandoravirus belohorizontensis]